MVLIIVYCSSRQAGPGLSKLVPGGGDPEGGTLRHRQLRPPPFWRAAVCGFPIDWSVKAESPQKMTEVPAQQHSDGSCDSLFF